MLTTLSITLLTAIAGYLGNHIRPVTDKSNQPWLKRFHVGGVSVGVAICLLAVVNGWQVERQQSELERQQLQVREQLSQLAKVSGSVADISKDNRRSIAAARAALATAGDDLKDVKNDLNKSLGSLQQLQQAASQNQQLASQTVTQLGTTIVALDKVQETTGKTRDQLISAVASLKDLREQETCARINRGYIDATNALLDASFLDAQRARRICEWETEKARPTDEVLTCAEQLQAHIRAMIPTLRNMGISYKEPPALSEAMVELRAAPMSNLASVSQRQKLYNAAVIYEHDIGVLTTTWKVFLLTLDRSSPDYDRARDEMQMRVAKAITLQKPEFVDALRIDPDSKAASLNLLGK